MSFGGIVFMLLLIVGRAGYRWLQVSEHAKLTWAATTLWSDDPQTRDLAA